MCKKCDELERLSQEVSALIFGGRQITSIARQMLLDWLCKYGFDEVLYAISESQKYLGHESETTHGKMEHAFEKIGGILFIRQKRSSGRLYHEWGD